MANHLFFTLDRLRTLTSGMKIELTEPHCPIVPLQAHTSSLFSDGVSRHANNLFFNYHINLVSSDERFGAIIEILLEERRKSHFPEKPSRFQSIFACESVKEAAWFRGFSKFPLDTPIFQVNSSSNYHRGDMNLLNLNCSPVEISQRLELYWKGETTQIYAGYQPFWEVLIPLPVIIGERIIE